MATRRLFAIGAGIAATIIMVFGLLLASYRDQSVSLSGLQLWAILDLTLIVVTGVLSPWLDGRKLRAFSTIGSAGFIAIMAGSVAQAAMVPQSTSGIVPWILTSASAAVVAGLLAGGLIGAWSVLITSVAATQILRVFNNDHEPGLWANDTHALMSGVVLGFIGAHVIAVSRRLDETAAERTTAGGAASAARGRLAARSRTAAVVHDEVLATLNIAGSGLPVPRARLAEQASHARDLINGLTLDATGDTSPLTSFLIAEATAIDPEARVSVHGTDSPHVPASVRAALTTALRQALQNSIRHAGPAARRDVTIDVAADALAVTITDTGVGFTPVEVPDDRLGIRTSIVQRMHNVGGTAMIDSSPGDGTRVRLSWAPSASPEITPDRNTRLLRIGLAVVAVVFVASQTAMAVIATATAPVWWLPIAVLAILLTASEVLRLSPSEHPTKPRLTAVIALITIAVTVGSLASAFTYSDMWFAVTAALIGAALAFREQAVAAAITGAITVAIIIIAGIHHGATTLNIILLSTRPVIFVTLSIALALTVVSMQRRTAILHSRAVSDAEHAAWDAAARAELVERGREVHELVDATLQEIAQGDKLTVEQEQRCLALEGRLRDNIRAGRLAREPLLSEAMRARARGVDVILLDDLQDDAPMDVDIDDVVQWMAAELTGASTRAVGRLLPEGRTAAASLLVDDETTNFGG